MKSFFLNQKRVTLLQLAHLFEGDKMHPYAYIGYLNYHLEFLMHNLVWSTNRVLANNDIGFQKYLSDNSEQTFGVLPSMVEFGGLHNALVDVVREKELADEEMNSDIVSINGVLVDSSLFQEDIPFGEDLFEDSGKSLPVEEKEVRKEYNSGIVSINGVLVDTSLFQEDISLPFYEEVPSVEEEVTSGEEDDELLTVNNIPEELTYGQEYSYVYKPEPSEEKIPEDGGMNEDLNRLEEILDEYGRINGMGALNFLAFAGALNELGYFREFSANKKEVHIKLDPSETLPYGKKGMYHTWHGDKRGISNTTASKFRGMIEALREKILEE